MMNVTLVGESELRAKLDRYTSGVREHLYATMLGLAIKLETYIKTDKLSGQVLNVGPNTPIHTGGQLRRSIANSVTADATGVRARVFSSGDVPYAAIHEFGGVIPPHEIHARWKQALAFQMGGKQVIVKSVHHPGAVMPERSYMRSALADMSDEIVEQMKMAVMFGLTQ